MSLEKFETAKTNLESTMSKLESTMSILETLQKQYTSLSKRMELLQLENEKLKSEVMSAKNVTITNPIKLVSGSKKRLYIFYQENTFTSNQIETIKKNVTNLLGLELVVVTKATERTTDDPLLYAVNFTSRFESTNLDVVELNTFKRISTGKTILLAMTMGDSTYSEMAPRVLSTGEHIVQLFVDFQTGNFNLKSQYTVEGFKQIVSLLK